MPKMNLDGLSEKYDSLNHDEIPRELTLGSPRNNPFEIKEM